MKISKKILSILLAVLMIAGTFSSLLVAGAATEKNLKTDNSFVEVKSNGYYKVTVKDEGCLTVTIKVAGPKSYSSAGADFTVLNSKKKDFGILWNNEGSAYIWGKGTKTDSVECAVSKGTYYIKISDYSVDDGGSVSVKCSFKSVKQPANYCAGKAAKLEKGKMVTIYQTQKCYYDRWYIITLKSNQKVTFSTSNIDSLYMFDSEGNDVKTKYISSGKYQTAKLAKGTYYVCADSLTRVEKTEILTLKWS